MSGETIILNWSSVDKCPGKKGHRDRVVLAVFKCDPFTLGLWTALFEVGNGLLLVVFSMLPMVHG